MNQIKVFNVEIDGIDKTGKDSIKPYIFYLEPGKFLTRSRGLISQLAYAKLYGREFDWDALEYTKNTLFVLLTVDELDWSIRCKITNEPNTGFTFEQMQNAFMNAYVEVKDRFDVPDKQMLIIDTTAHTPHVIASAIISRLNELNT